MNEKKDYRISALRDEWEIKNMRSCVTTRMDNFYVFELEEKIVELKNGIAILQERFYGDYEKFSDFDNISLVVDTLEKLR